MGSTSAGWPCSARLATAWVLAGLAALACGRAVPEAGGSSRAADQPALTVATSGDYAPFSLWPEDATEPRGFSADVARAFAADRGRRIEWIRFRWPRLEKDLAAGRFDLALSGITIRPDRSLAGRFSLPLTETGAIALVAAGSTVWTPDQLDRPSIRIAVNRGGHLERVARTLFPSARILALPDNAAVPEALRSGQAEAALTDTLEAPHWRMRLPATRALGPLTHDRKAAWLPIGREALLRDFDRWLLTAEATGELGRLRQRHGLAHTRTAEPIEALLASLDERLSLMPAVARAKRILGLPIEDRAQEARVHEAARRSVLEAARELACEPPAESVLRRFVEAQLRAARFVQERASEQTEGLPPAQLDADAARGELDRQIRPALASISDRIAWLVLASRSPAAATGSSRPSSPPTRAAVAAALASHALPDELVAEIQGALDALVTAPPRARRAAPAPPSPAGLRGTSPTG